MLTEREKLGQLIKDIEEANKQKDTRKIILIFGIYSEYIVNELLKLKLTHRLDKDIRSQEIKLKILRATNNIAESEYLVLDKLKQIRNKYAHKLELEIDKEKIIKWMLETPVNWKMSLEERKLMEEQIKKYPFVKFQIACMAKMSHLFQKLATLKNEESFQDSSIKFFGLNLHILTSKRIIKKGDLK